MAFFLLSSVQNSSQLSKNLRNRLYFNYFKDRFVHFNGTIMTQILW